MSVPEIVLHAPIDPTKPAVDATFDATVAANFSPAEAPAPVPVLTAETPAPPLPKVGVVGKLYLRYELWRLERRERWSSMSPARRAACRVGAIATSAAGIFVALNTVRISGAVAAEVGLDFGPSTNGANMTPDTPEPTGNPFGEAATVAATNNDGTFSDLLDTVSKTVHAVAETASQNGPHGPAGNIELPADTTQAPKPGVLEPFGPDTHLDTVWGWAGAYAGELGYDKLDSAQQHAVTEYILSLNVDPHDGGPLTWEGARHLPDGYQVVLGPQDKMLAVLEEAGATRAHEATSPATPQTNAPEPHGALPEHHTDAPADKPSSSDIPFSAIVEASVKEARWRAAEWWDKHKNPLSWFAVALFSGAAVLAFLRLKKRKKIPVVATATAAAPTGDVRPSPASAPADPKPDDPPSSFRQRLRASMRRWLRTVRRR